MILAAIIFSIGMLLSIVMNGGYMVTNYLGESFIDPGYLLYGVPITNLVIDMVFITSAIMGACYYRQTVNILEGRTRSKIMMV